VGRQRVTAPPSRGTALATSEEPDAVPLLGKIDQQEVRREGANDRFRLDRLEQGDLSPERFPVIRRAATTADCAASQAFHEVEELAPGLLDDHLPEQGAKQPNLARQWIARASAADAPGLGTLGRMASHAAKFVSWRQ
jgi:hypothetical protein